MGKHHAGRNVCYTKTTYNTGTAQMTTYRSMVLHKKRLPRVASMALGVVVSLGIALAAGGVVVSDPPEEPALAVIVPASVTHQPEQVVEPPVLTPPPSPARLVRPRVVRAWPDMRRWPHRWLDDLPTGT